MRVLLVDDDVSLCSMLTEFLARHQVTVESVHRGDEALTAFAAARFDAVILDVMLPAIDGFTLLEQLRRTTRCPVIMLTARGDEMDRVYGLESGAADYVPKPFSARELLARLRVAQRLSQGDKTRQYDGTPAGRLELDEREGRVLLDGEPIELTHVESRVLKALLDADGNPVRREELYRYALGRDLLPYDRSLDTHISNLRRKFDAHCRDGATIRIRAIRGTGYLLLQ